MTSSIDALLAEQEGKTLEFKLDASSPDNLVKTVVAFANGAGGTVLLGVEDRSRRVRGIADPTALEERIANLIFDRIEPRLVPELEIIPWRKTHLVAIRVFPSSTRPHFIRAQGPRQGVYVRVGSTNRRADAAQVDELLRLVRGRTFDEEPLSEMDSEEIDFRAVAECFAPVRRLRLNDLRTLQITTMQQGRSVPTVGGLLLFGRDRFARFPDAYLRAGCFATVDRSSIVDSLDIRHYLPAAVDEALHFVKRNLRRALRIEGARHAEVWEVPLVALREAVVNALVHADYAQVGSPIRLALFGDRIEVENPGGLPPGLTIGDIQRGVSKLRNRVIGRVFHELRLSEQWGSGIHRMNEACRQAGLPTPVFEELGTCFRVTFFRGPRQEQALDDLDQRILDLVRRSSGVSTAQVAAHIGRTTRATRGRLARLIELGLLVAVGSGPRDPRRQFFTSG